MLEQADLTALLLTLKLALISTFILLLICLPVAWWLAKSEGHFKTIVEAVLALPLILPPTVLGFYLLLLLGSNGLIGKFSQKIGMEPLAFSFTGLVIGSIVYSLPFVIQPLKNSFVTIGRRPLEVAATLGASPVDCFFSVILPLIRPGLLSATVLGFAHTVGEFGVVLMIGGNIPGRTQVVSIKIYEHVESLNYVQAHLLSFTLLTISFLLLFLVFYFNRGVRVLT